MNNSEFLNEENEINESFLPSNTEGADENMKTFDLLDELTDEIEASPRAAFSRKPAIDYDVVMEIIEDIRASLPEDIILAQDIINEKNAILIEAREEAESILNGAQDRVDQLVENSEITQKAYKKSIEITEAAKENAREIREGVFEYADEIMGRLELDLESYLMVVRDNRKELTTPKKSKSQGKD